jgi:fructokinase
MAAIYTAGWGSEARPRRSASISPVIVVGGEALIDLVLHEDGRLTAVPGGGPYNTARTIARLGAPVAFLGGLSTDRFGRQLHEGLRRDGVDDTIAVPTDAPTTLAVAEVDDLGVATYRFYTAGTSANALDPEHVPSLAGRTVRALHVGTLGLVLEPLAAAIEALVDSVPEDTVVMIDPNCRPTATVDPDGYRARVDRLLRRADIVKVSTDDLAFLRSGVDPSAAAAGLLRSGASVVLWTDGPAVVNVVTPRGRSSLKPPAVKVVDTVGAGDAFGGGFLAAWIGSGHGRSELASDEALMAATRQATLVASFTCTRAGAEPPTAAELAAWGPMP